MRFPNQWIEFLHSTSRLTDHDRRDCWIQDARLASYMLLNKKDLKEPCFGWIYPIFFHRQYTSYIACGRKWGEDVEKISGGPRKVTAGIARFTKNSNFIGELC